MKIYVTIHPQKDGRITTGTCVHKYLDCPSLKSRTGIVVTVADNPLIENLPKCNYCFERAVNIQ